jgi:succinoglycan biosynthesis transport protein ExoP
MELNQYFAVLKRWWWLILASTLVAAISSYMAVSRVPRVYQATTTVIVGQGLQKSNPTDQDLWISQQLAQTYREMAVRQPILQGAAEALGLTFVPSPKDITAGLVPGTQFLEISVRDTEPERARALADGIAQQLILQTPNEIAEDQRRQTFVQSQLRSLEQNIQTTQDEIEAERAKLDTATSARAIEQYQQNIAAMQDKIASYQDTYASLLNTVQGRTNYISVFEQAATPTQPISPRVMETVLTAAAIGLILALGGAFLIEFLDDTIKMPADVTHIPNLLTLAVMPEWKNGGEDERPIIVRQPSSTLAEAFRSLRTNIQGLSVDKPLCTLLVTSPGPGDGKTTTVANLGVVLAKAGKSVILIDADLRRSTLHKIFQVPNKQGLTSLLYEKEPEIDGTLQETDIENLRILTSGPLPLNPSELLSSRKMGALVQELRGRADVIVFDTPPTLPVTDAAVLAAQADGVLVVARAGKTRRGALRQTVDNLQQVGAHILGTTLNGVAFKQMRGYGYYYYSYKDAPAEPARRKKRWWQQISWLRNLGSR